MARGQGKPGAGSSGRRPDGRQVRWDQHKLERRRQIVDAAIELIQEQGADSEVHVVQIAERAGMVRTVVYRHFTDRADLDDAVQERVVEMLRERLDPQVTLEGSIEEIILRIVTAYVTWAADHPELHRLVGRAAGDRPMSSAIDGVASQVQSLVRLAAEILEVDLPEEMSQSLDPFVFGIVGQAFATVGRWVSRPTLEPDAATYSRLFARSVWYQIDGHLRSIGVEFDPTVDVTELTLTAMATRAGGR